MHKLFVVYFVNLYISGVSRPITRRYNHMYTDSHLKRISTNCCIWIVVPPDDGPRYIRNM